MNRPASVDLARDADTHASTGARHIPALDGVRGIAILMVIVYHFFILPQTRSKLAFDNGLFKIAECGWAGVDLFFVLSGFLITSILLDAKGGAGYFRSFYARRFLRIFPVYYIGLAVMLFALPVFPWFARQDSVQDVADQQLWYWTYLINIRAAFMPFEAYGFATGHFWSLAVEEQFYLLWPAVVFFCGRRTLVGVCAGCVVGALALRIVFATIDFEQVIPQYAMTTLMPSRVDTLAVGGLIAAVARDPVDARRIAQRYALPAATGALAVLVGLGVFTDGRSLTFGDYWVETIGVSALAIFFGTVVLWSVAATAGSALDRILRLPVLTVFGRYSYTLYVVHLPIAVFLIARYQEHNRWPIVAGSDLIGRLVFSFIGVSMSLAIAWASWNLIEQPILRLKRYFPYQRRPAQAADAVAREPAGIAAAASEHHA